MLEVAAQLPRCPLAPICSLLSCNFHFLLGERPDLNIAFRSRSTGLLIGSTRQHAGGRNQPWAGFDGTGEPTAQIGHTMPCLLVRLPSLVLICPLGFELSLDDVAGNGLLSKHDAFSLMRPQRHISIGLWPNREAAEALSKGQAV